MITTRFKDVVWTGGICVAALSFYMVSQTVAAKRAELTSVERKIVATQQDIRELRTEIDTRGGLAQIEKWNQTVYGLQAPGPEQFVTTSVRLVALTQPQGLPLDPAIVASHGALNKVSYTQIDENGLDAPRARAVAAPAQIQPPQPTLHQANYVQPTPSALAPQGASPVREVAERKLIRAVRLDDNFLDGLAEETPARARKGKQ
ncbi:MAG: hypothetical protein V4618_20245 [Pseudomonadota bacterium]